MTGTAIYWPMMAQVALTAVAYVVMSKRRVAAVKGGEARAGDFRVPRDPESSATAARNVTNQFELPVLFYVACLGFYQLGAVGPVAVALAWLFVALRVVHAYVHMGSNDVRLRRGVFTGGFAVVLLMWIWLAVAVVTTT